jgi:hypothetical protein
MAVLMPKHAIRRINKVKIVALRTEYIVLERHINATRCLNIIYQTLIIQIKIVIKRLFFYTQNTTLHQSLKALSVSYVNKFSGCSLPSEKSPGSSHM